MNRFSFANQWKWLEDVDLIRISIFSGKAFKGIFIALLGFEVYINILK